MPSLPPQWTASGGSAPHPPQGLQDPGPLLVFDGGCPFCRHFAELSERSGGIPALRIHDGRADPALLRPLESEGLRLRDGAFVVREGQVLHGAEAIAWLCSRMAPAAPLLQLLAPVFAGGARSRRLYPLLLAARRLALAARGLPVDPSAAASAQQG